MTDELSDFARGMRASGMELDDVLVKLRDRGASIMDCIKIVIAGEQVGLGEAKVIVDASPAWAHVRESNRALREHVVEVFRDLED